MCSVSARWARTENTAFLHPRRSPSRPAPTPFALSQRVFIFRQLFSTSRRFRGGVKIVLQFSVIHDKLFYASRISDNTSRPEYITNRYTRAVLVTVLLRFRVKSLKVLKPRLFYDGVFRANSSLLPMIELLMYFFFFLIRKRIDYRDS